MLQVDPEQRIKIAEMLTHPWFGASFRDMACSINDELLEMPDALLTGRAWTPFPIQSSPEHSFALRKRGSHQLDQSLRTRQHFARLMKTGIGAVKSKRLALNKI